MKKLLVVGIIVLFIGLAVIPSINANDSIIPVKSKLVDMRFRIYRGRGITPFILRLTERESKEVDIIFDNLKVSLDSAETGEEIDAIYDDAVESLYELGMFPRMTLKQAKQLVKGDSKKTQSGSLGAGDENFNCSIAGRTTETYIFKLDNPSLNNLLWYLRNFFFIPGIEHWRCINLLFYIGEIGEISFGRYERDGDDYYSVDGWVSTDGSNGVVEWNGEFYGNLGRKLVYEDVWYEIKEYVFTGISNFNGLWIGRLFPNIPVYFLGNAEHVSLTYTPSWLD